MSIHYHTNLNNFDTACGIPRWPWCLFTPFPARPAPGRSGRGSSVPALRWAVHQRRPSSRVLLLFNRWWWWLRGGASGARSLCRAAAASAPVTTYCDCAIRPSWTPLRRGMNNWRNSPAKSGRLIGCAPGHQVTPRLCTLFRAGASGDFSPSRAFQHRGIRWLLAVARRGIMLLTATLRWGPLYCWRVGKRQKRFIAGRCTEAGGAISPWTSERVESFTHSSCWCGAGIMWIREQCLPNKAVADVGLVSCE